jgi:hypothetical protein
MSLLTRYLAYRREVAAPGIAPPSWMTLFDVNGEANVPTWFSVVLLLGASSAAGGAALLNRRAAPRRARFYLLVGLALAALSLDELVGLHERLGAVGAAVAGGSPLHFVWVLPGAVLAGVLLVGLVLGGRSVSAATRRRLWVAVAVYFAGALGAEVLSGQVLVAQGDRAAYLLVTGAEEFLEMVGSILVIRALLKTVRTEPVPGGWTLRAVASST